MKQKYTLTLLAALTLGAAQADVARIHYWGNTGEVINGVYQNGETYVDVGANNLRSIFRGQDESKGSLYICFGDADHTVLTGTYMFNDPLFRRVEFIHPEAVTVEIDMPKAFQMIWTPMMDDQYKYSLEYPGRIKFVDGADTSKPSKGTLFIVNGNYSDDTPANWLADDAAVEYDGETETTYNTGVITFSDCSSNITQKIWSEFGYNWTYTRLDYVIGGDNPNEATFTISIPSNCFVLSDIHSVLVSDDNSFNDQYNIGGSTIGGISNYGGVSKSTYIRTGHLTTQQLSYKVPSTIAALGGTVKVKLSSITVESPIDEQNTLVQSIPQWAWKEIIGDVTEWTIPISNTTYSGWSVDTESYSVDVNYDFSELDFSKLDLVGGIEDISQISAINVNFTTSGFETDAPTNSWLDAMMSVINQQSQWISHKFYLLPEEDYLLSIDVNKMSFPDCEPTEGSLAALFDDDPSTFCHSAWSIQNDRSEPYGSYIDIELDEPIQSVGFAMQARDNSSPMPPTEMHLYCSNDGENWTLLGEANGHWGGTISASWDTTYAGESNWFTADEPFKYLRWCVIKNLRAESLTETGTSTSRYWNLAELHFYGK